MMSATTLPPSPSLLAAPRKMKTKDTAIITRMRSNAELTVHWRMGIISTTSNAKPRIAAVATTVFSAPSAFIRYMTR